MATRDTIGLSEHVAYEIDRLLAFHGKLVGREDVADGYIQDALIEGFALHLRNVVEFLYDPRKKPDDGRAEDYFTDPARWAKVRGEKPPELDQAQKQAHKQISHITYGRIGADKRWYVGNLAEQVSEKIRLFLDRADEDRMGPQLKVLKKSFRQF